jgi:alpha-D-xyloside xylohydrolase
MLAFDFMHDKTAREIMDQYMLGHALLICPVLEKDARSRKVYLPSGADWYDFHTGRRFTGGQWILADAPLETIPLYVRAGSILPLGPIKQYAAEKAD